MAFKKRSTVRKKATARMLLNNPSSGVPLASNAANLNNFFCSKGMSDGILTDSAQGAIVFDTSVMGSSATPLIANVNADKSFTVMGGIELNTVVDAIVSGSWPQLSVTDDCLIIISAIAGVNTSENSTIFRIGNNSSALLRIHASYDITGGFPGGGSFNDTGQTGNVHTQGAADGARVAIGNDMCSVLAIDRTANLMSTKIWDYGTASEVVDTIPTIDISTLGEANISSSVGTSTTEVAISMQGRFYGIAVYEFPGKSLPLDYFEAAIQMAEAWRNGNYTFWPYWGKR